jgi:hypothetical protein
MKLTVFRYQVDDHADVAPYYAVREYVENLKGASVIEDNFIEVDESDFDVHGRIAAD